MFIICIVHSVWDHLRQRSVICSACKNLSESSCCITIVHRIGESLMLPRLLHFNSTLEQVLSSLLPACLSSAHVNTILFVQETLHGTAMLVCTLTKTVNKVKRVAGINSLSGHTAAIGHAMNPRVQTRHVLMDIHSRQEYPVSGRTAVYACTKIGSYTVGTKMTQLLATRVAPKKNPNTQNTITDTL